MKKLIALTLALIFCLAIFAGCGQKTGDEVTDAPDTDNVTDAPDNGGETDTALYEQAKGKTYTVGTDTTFAPFEFEDDNGNHTGIDIQLLEGIAEEMGFTVEWSILGFTASVTALEAGQVDAMIAGMSITDERELKYDFSDSYYSTTTGVAVKADADFESLEDLRGQTVIAKTGTEGAKYAESIMDEYELNLIYVDESAIMYTYVESSQAMACFEDYPVIQYEIARGNVGCKVIHQSEASTPYGFAVLKDNNPELIAAFNEGLKRFKENGTYDEILNTYFGEN